MVKDGTGPVFQQGVSHRGKHICSQVKSSCNHVSLLNDSRDRFVHINRFQLLFTCDIESKGSQKSVLPAVVSVQDGSKHVRGKKVYT